MTRTNIPGVTLVRGSTVISPWQVMFKHPLRRKMVKLSVGTNDVAVAREVAAYLSGLLTNPDAWYRLPDDAPPIVQKIWWYGLDAPEGQASLLKAAIIIDDLMRPLPGISDKADAAAKENPAAAEFKALTDRVVQLEAMLAASQAKLARSEALLVKLGGDAAKDYKPVLLSTAIESYTSDDPRRSGTRASSRGKRQCSICLRAFAKTLPENSMLHDVQPRAVEEYLAGLLAGGTASPATVGTYGAVISRFLRRATRGLFRSEPVKAWIEVHCRERAQRETPYWLDAADVKKLTGKMAEMFPACWADLAVVQFAGGFRPEELCHVQTAKVLRDGETRVEICDLVDGDKLHWRPKTDKSRGKVHLPAWASRSVEALAGHGTLLLFPDDESWHGGWVNRNWDRCTDFQRKNRLWVDTERFTEQYKARLRAAAKAVGLDHERVDGRTLRRSCGKRILLAALKDKAIGSALELAAAVLRDLPSTVRKHYASLLPDDVRQPE